MVREPEAPKVSPEVAAGLPPDALAIQAQIAASLAHAAVQRPALPTAPLASPGLPLPILRNVIPADLGDVGRLEALRQQALTRGWLRDSAADRLNLIATAVHARRVGQAPCRLFVALLRERRWEVITLEDEDTARAWLRTARDGPARGGEPEAAAPAPAPVVPRSADADVVDAVQRALPSAWRDRPFLFLKLQDPTWTLTRWEQAQAELAQWRLLQAQAKARSQLVSLGSFLEEAGPWEDEEEDEGDATG